MSSHNKDFSITKMSVLKVATELLIHNAGDKPVEVKAVVELADKLAAWAFVADNPHITVMERK